MKSSQRLKVKNIQRHLSAVDSRLTNRIQLEISTYLYFSMTSLRATCSIEGCKRAVTCLCRHCDQDVCSKHFNEHQTEVNNQLIPFADRLNECNYLLVR